MEATPKPWRFTRHLIQAGDPGSVRTIAELLTLDPAELDANGRLIAAAPDLADGLLDMFRLIDDGTLVRSVANEGGQDWHFRMLDLVARLKKAQDALLRAGITLALVLAGCGAVPDGVTPSWALGACTNPDAMQCDHGTGTTYYCDPPHWTRLMDCPDGGCPFREDNARSSTQAWQVCEVSQ